LPKLSDFNREVRIGAQSYGCLFHSVFPELGLGNYMADFETAVRKYGDPLLDPSQAHCKCYCLIDRPHHKVILSIADSRFPSLKDETKMAWLREFGVVSDALNPAYAFPPSVEELFASISPPDQFSPIKTISIVLEGKQARESVAWFSRAFLQLLDSEELSVETKSLFQLEWANYAGEQFKAPLRDFQNHPRIISQG